MAGTSAFSGSSLVASAFLSLQLWVSFIFFLALDLADSLLCFIFWGVDSVVGDHWGPCYCYSPPHAVSVPQLPRGQEKNLLSHADRPPTEQDALIAAVDGRCRDQWDPCFQHSPLVSSRKRTLRLGETATISLPLSRSLSSITELPVASSSPPPLVSPLSKSEPSLQSLDQSTGTGAGHRSAVSASRISGRKWTDCSCTECAREEEAEQPRLHVEILDPPSQQGNPLRDEDSGDAASAPDIDSEEPSTAGDVVFLHGFCSSSSFWADTAVPQLSPKFRRKHRLLLVDLLGFGKSPKPRDSLYTVGEHAE